jgi:hypothetical protein
VARELEEAIEDFAIDRGLRAAYGVGDPWSPDYDDGGSLGNPGRDYSSWRDLDGDGEPEAIHLSAEELGYPPPERRYLALELSAEHRFSESWLFFAAYTWSHSYGNWEGLVNSDVGHPIAGGNPAFDSPAYLEHAYGDLPNDRRHSVKVHGAHSWRNGLQLGGTFFYRTGRPVNSFGFHPTDERAVLPFAFYTDGEPTPRGSMGRTDDVWSLDLSLGYSWPWGKTELDARVSVLNLFNNHAVVEVEEQAEYANYNTYPYTIYSNPDWGETTAYQSPRSVRLSLGVAF